MAGYYPTPPPTSSPKHATSYPAFQPKLYAQDPSLPQTFSTPNSPIQTSQQPYEYAYTVPPRRRSSPPYARKSPPRPLHFSPTNPPPSPYNSSRPSPRPGFITRMLRKLDRGIRSFMRWAKTNPIKAGFLTFLPVMAGVGVVKLAKTLGRGLGILEKGYGRTKLDKGIGKGAGKEAERVWGWGLDEFKGFGGSKAGPLDGIIKIVQMLVNHWCKLTPSAIPRTASILMELYFLDIKK